jgi:hypothetical protein
VVELTAEEKAEARQNAIRQYQDGLMREMQNRHKPRTDANKEMLASHKVDTSDC